MVANVAVGTMIDDGSDVNGDDEPGIGDTPNNDDDDNDDEEEASDKDTDGGVS